MKTRTKVFNDHFLPWKKCCNIQQSVAKSIFFLLQISFHNCFSESNHSLLEQAMSCGKSSINDSREVDCKNRRMSRSGRFSKSNQVLTKDRFCKSNVKSTIPFVCNICIMEVRASLKIDRKSLGQEKFQVLSNFVPFYLQITATVKHIFQSLLSYNTKAAVPSFKRYIFLQVPYKHSE